MLDRAKFLVISEISEVAREKTEAIEEKVDRALERCFATKTRSIARAKAAKAAPTSRVTVKRTAQGVVGRTSDADCDQAGRRPRRG